MTMTYWIVGRRYCPECDRVRTIVRHPDIEDVPCPACHVPTVPASGHDVRHVETS